MFFVISVLFVAPNPIPAHRNRASRPGSSPLRLFSSAPLREYQSFSNFVPFVVINSLVAASGCPMPFVVIPYSVAPTGCPVFFVALDSIPRVPRRKRQEP